MKQEKAPHAFDTEAGQNYLISFMLSDPEALARCSHILKPDYFDDMFKRSVRFILAYQDQYNAIPPIEAVVAHASGSARLGTGIIYNLMEGTAQHRQHFLDEIENFCRRRALFLTALDSLDLIEAGEEGEYERRVKEAILIRLKPDRGTCLVADPKGTLERLRANPYLSTGWKTLDDKLYGGFNRGTLNLFAGNSGSGKSMFLQNLALNYAEQGLNVIFFSLEQDESGIAQRMYSMISQVPCKGMFSNIDKVDLAVRLWAKKNVGSLYIKQFPCAGTTTADLRAYLKDAEIAGHRYDVIIVDYLDLLYPTTSIRDLSDHFSKDKIVSEELRGMGSTEDAVLISASQLNRSSIGADRFDHSHIAGGISKINTADNVFAIKGNNSMREKGIYQLEILKTRSSAGVGSVVELAYSTATMRLKDKQ